MNLISHETDGAAPSCPQCGRPASAEHLYCVYCGALVRGGGDLSGFGAEITWLESFTDGTRDAVMISDAGGVVVMANEVALAVLDLDRARTSGDRPNLGALLEQSGGGELVEVVQVRLDLGQPWRGLVSLPILSGESFDVDVVVLPISDTGGASIGAAMVVRDLLVIAEHAYRETDDAGGGVVLEPTPPPQAGVDGQESPGPPDLPGGRTTSEDLPPGKASPWIPADPASDPASDPAPGPADPPLVGTVEQLLEVLRPLAGSSAVVATMVAQFESGVSVDEVVGGLLTGEGLLDLASVLEPITTSLPSVLLLCRLDGLVRFGRSSVNEVHEAYRLLSEADPPPLHLWLAAVASEFHLWQGELTGLLVADAALKGQGADGSRIGRVSRARLRRLVTLVEFAGDDTKVDLEAFRSTIEEFRLLGAPEEEALTVVLAALTVSIFRDSSVLDAAQPEFAGAVAELERSGAGRLRVALVALAWIGSAYPDTALMADALGRYHRRFDGIGGWPILDRMVDYLDVVFEILDYSLESSTPEVRDRLTAAVQDLREIRLPATGAQMLAVMLLLDLGWWEDARTLLFGVDVSLLYNPVLVRNRDVRVLRIDLFRNRPGARDRLVAEAEARCDEPPSRMHGYLLIRLGRDLLRCGFITEGQRFSGAGERMLEAVTPGPRTRFESMLLSPPNVALPVAEPALVRSADASAGVVEAGAEHPPARAQIRALSPDLEVWREGTQVTITPLQAHMLVTLVVARGPVSTEWFVETVWPEVSPEVGKNRLKAQMHKLRKALGIESGELINRSGAGLALEPGDGWSIDLWEVIARPPTAAADLEIVATILPQVCDRQFAYDDEVAVARALVHDRWAAAAHRSLDAETITSVALSRRLLEVGFADPGLIDRLLGTLDPSRDGSTIDALSALSAR